MKRGAKKRKAKLDPYYVLLQNGLIMKLAERIGLAIGQQLAKALKP